MKFNEPQLFIYKLLVCYTDQPIIGTICANSAAEAVERLEDEYGRGSIESYGIRPLKDDLLDFTTDASIGSAEAHSIDFTFDPDDEDYGYTDFVDGELDEEGEPQVYQVSCPNCGRTLYFDSIDVQKHHHLTCPSCGCFIKEIKEIELTDEEPPDEDEDDEEDTNL